MAIIIQMRRDIAANWTSNNPLLAQGEWGHELDTLKFKIGDGATRWNVLPYVIPSTDATTASNIGSGAGVFSSKSVNDLQFKSLLGSNGVTVSSGIDTITISGASLSGYATESWVNSNFIDNSEMSTISGNILTYVSNNYIDNSEMTVISGNILTYVSNNYIDNSEMATISGNILTYVSNNYIDNSEMATISGNIISSITGASGIIDHGKLTGLNDDDHPQYTLANGTRAFTSTVSGIYPTLDNHLATKKYADDNDIFGSNFNVFTSDTVSITTSNSFQTKVSGTTNTLVSGTYRIGVSYGWNHDSTANDFESRVLFDGNQLGASHAENPADSGGASWSGTGTDQRFYGTRTFYTTITGLATHSVVLEYRSSVAGISSSIWDAVIELWRVR